MTKEARISITPYCNYKCFFCHNEGLDKKAKSQPDEKGVKHLINHLMEKGWNDITFTGGEPLLRKDMVLSLLETIKQKQKDLPQITIVTNLSLMTEEIAQHLSDYPNLKLNISIHTADDVHYPKVTGQRRFTLDRFKQNLNLLRKYSLKFKLNSVVLKGINNQPEQIQQLIDTAVESGATHLKFIELLVKKGNEDLYPYFYDIESIEEIIKNQAQLSVVEARRKIYVHHYAPLKIELQKCICKLGCSKCWEYRDQTFSTDLYYYPCFEFNRINYNLKECSLSDAIAQGEKSVKKLAAQYGVHSPSLIQDITYTNAKEELYFLISSPNAHKLVDKSRLIEKMSVKDVYYAHPSYARNSRKKMWVHKIRLHHTNDKIAKIISYQHWIEKDGLLPVHKTVFLDAEREVFKGNPEMAEKIMNAFGLVEKRTVSMDISEYKTRGIRFSLTTINGKVIGRILMTDGNNDINEILSLAQEYKFQFIRTRFVDYLMKITA